MKMSNVLFAALLTVSACASSSGGSKPSETPATSSKSLYERLGGKDAITAVVGSFVTRLAADARINARFANSDIPHLKQMLVEQICSATGGPEKYTGKDMKTTHAGMNITEDEFNALVEDLKGALDEFKVGADEQKQLLGALGGMKGDIVGQ